MAEIITPGGSKSEQPKIVVDSDWKAQAQAERDRLAEQEAKSPKSAKAGAGLGLEGDDLPPADFRTIVGLLATQAVMYLGGYADPQGRVVVVPDYAQHHIDLLAVLQEKTRGNLTEEEQQDLDAVVDELRRRFVQIMGMAREAARREGARAPGGPTGPGPVVG